jgi:hypothetical protein
VTTVTNCLDRLRVASFIRKPGTAFSAWLADSPAARRIARVLHAVLVRTDPPGRDCRRRLRLEAVRGRIVGQIDHLVGRGGAKAVQALLRVAVVLLGAEFTPGLRQAKQGHAAPAAVRRAGDEAGAVNSR